MNRDRKYRVWDKKQNRMFYSLNALRVNWNKITGSDLFCEIEANDGKNGKWTCSDNPEEYVIMDYTGLLDKEGNEIYELDIVKLVNADGDEIYAVCEYGLVRRHVVGGNGPVEVDIPCFYFRVNNHKTFPIVNNYAGKHDLELFEVCGTIFTTPELLK